jgi:hypothetical protein
MKTNEYLRAAVKLQEYLFANHWNGQALIGPDPGLRLNYRIGRFIKSYLRRLSWNDDVYILQAQGYWVLGNWALFKRTGEEKNREIALRCSEHITAQQRNDGAWDYPLPQWKGRIATVEGIWASIGLLESYRQTAAPAFLTGALQWYEFMNESIGFQRVGDGLAINYFANFGDVQVPNNSTNVLRFLAELTDATRDETYLQPCAELLTFLQKAQETTGEFPYAVRGENGGKGRLHFQCYQYNAFQCLGLMRYYEITGDKAALPLISGVLRFLRNGLGADGHAFYQCGNRYRAVTYHAAALGATFTKASHLGLESWEDLAHRAFSYVLRLQRPEGVFVHSRKDYHLLSDHRSYPRYLAMILYSLLIQDSMVGNPIKGVQNGDEDEIKA